MTESHKELGTWGEQSICKYYWLKCYRPSFWWWGYMEMWEKDEKITHMTIWGHIVGRILRMKFLLREGEL